jgi:hypothetical protein
MNDECSASSEAFSATEAEEWLGWLTNYSIHIGLSVTAAFEFSNFFLSSAQRIPHDPMFIARIGNIFGLQISRHTVVSALSEAFSVNEA